MTVSCLYLGVELKECFERLKSQFEPDIVLTHYRSDFHQDHRLISELTWNTFRNHLILEYEIPKYDGDFGSPNVFVPLDEPTCQRKIDIVLEAFLSQANKHWFSRDVFSSVLTPARNGGERVQWLCRGFLLPQGNFRNGGLMNVLVTGHAGYIGVCAGSNVVRRRT